MSELRATCYPSVSATEGSGRNVFIYELLHFVINSVVEKHVL